jgi:signal transduction histidine kinase
VGFAASRLEQRMPGEQGSIAILHRAVGRMERLIDDLLTLSRLEAAPPDSVCDPAEAVAEVQEDMAARLRDGDAKLNVHVDSAPVRCAPGLLRQAIFNLADNAMKYRRPEVPLEVDVDGRRVDGRYELCVRDNGLGMSPEQARQAFDPFYRALEVRDKPGTGLGLSIVKRIAESAGGTVRVDSELGKGTELVVILPMATPVAAA